MQLRPLTIQLQKVGWDHKRPAPRSLVSAACATDFNSPWERCLRTPVKRASAYVGSFVKGVETREKFGCFRRLENRLETSSLERRAFRGVPVGACPTPKGYRGR